MVRPIVSVIIPCYNAQDNLAQCIDSILGQTLEQIQIICVDDGSSDATLEILQDYQARDPRVLVIRQQNAGAGAARNRGLEQATGEYLSFLDADDFFEPDMLEKAVAAAEKWQAEFVVFRSDRYYPAKDRYEDMPWAVRNSDLPPYMPFSYRQLTDNVFLSFVGWAWDKLFRRSFVEKHSLRFQEQRTTNDMLFVFSALICAGRIAVIQDVLAHQRRGAGDTLSVTREKSWHCFYDALIALRERLVREGVFWELEQDFINYCLHFSLWNLNTLAEPTHTLLRRKLCEEWFAELGIADKPESYFYNKVEYAQYKKLTKGQGRAVRKVPHEEAAEDVPLGDWPEPGGDVELPAGCDAIYGINIEFDRLRDRLMQDRQCWEKNKYRYWQRKYHCYQFQYQHAAPPVRKEYGARMRQEFKRAMQLGQLRKEDFTAGEWCAVQRIIRLSEGVVESLRKNSLIHAMKEIVLDSFKRYTER